MPLINSPQISRGSCFSPCRVPRNPYVKGAMIVLLALAVISLAVAQARGKVQPTKVVVLTYSVLIALICWVGCSALNQAPQVVDGIANLGNILDRHSPAKDRIHIVISQNDNTFAIDTKIFPLETTTAGQLKEAFAKHLGVDLKRVIFIFSGRELQDSKLLKDLNDPRPVLYCVILGKKE